MSEAAAAAVAFEAVVFDMDGVVTRTAALHAAAWKTLFDEFLDRRAREQGVAYEPFDQVNDYRAYVDGKPREDGVRGFLAARDIDVPEGNPDDEADAVTVYGLAKRKDTAFQQELGVRGVELFESTLALIHALKACHVAVGLVTSSRHGREILAGAGIDGLFDACVDGVDLRRRGLRGKPEPDAFLACAADLGVSPSACVVVEDAVSGVAAGRTGGFALVVGVDRGGNRHALLRHGADVVVDDLEALDVAALDQRFLAARRRASWRIEQEGFDPARERDVESLFTIGNGYLGVRGALDTPVSASQDDLFIAGIYDSKQPGLPYSEHEFMDPGSSEQPYREIVSLPFPFRLRVSVDGQTLSLADCPWTFHRRVLDMQAGVLESEARYEVGPGRFATVRSRRCASLANIHLLFQEVTVQLENHSAAVELDASFDGLDLDNKHPHLVPRPPRTVDEGIELHDFSTRVSGMRVCVAQRAMLEGSAASPPSWRAEVSIGEAVVLRRWIALHTSRDADDPEASAVATLRACDPAAFDQAFISHGDCWREIWRHADMQVDGSPATEQALRFHAYQLSSAADHDPTTSVGARALTGRAYEGHVFWDVEIFMLPFFLHTRPAVARSLLGYRHHTLDGARRHARELGFAGACYAWESTVTGEDVTPRVIVLRTTRKEIPIFTGTQQIHVTADVAYGVWRYWEATRDEAFMSGQGAEILVETARFWVSRSVAEAGTLHIRNVVGPDEYHHGVNDNAYTNWMARLNLENAAWALGWLAEQHPRARAELVERIGLEADEPEVWVDVARRLYFPDPDAHGVIEQFEGFFDLGSYALPAEERFKAPIDRLFDWDTINSLKVVKQADVLMLPFLFPDRFSTKALAANYRYYEPLTDHGSSLSPGVHGALAARLGRRELAERYWQQSLTLDLSNVMGNSTLGVHPACMGATWQALVFHMLGVRFTDDGPVADRAAAQRLPERWRSVAIELEWRGQAHRLEVTR